MARQIKEKSFEQYIIKTGPIMSSRLECKSSGAFNFVGMSLLSEYHLENLLAKCGFCAFIIIKL